ncbi:VOC family protein [Agromyces sp. NPDC056523]|uniref:VOC family protein n=1 Tax=Agromyces sp. NPDC056523 TaxID=3345850 RepID=UPI003671A0CA
MNDSTPVALRGLSTITLFADDMAAAQDWYTRMLGVEPYFFMPAPPASPAYVEFRIGDSQHELGIIDRRYAPEAQASTGGPITYWHVDDVHAAYARLLELGATAHEAVTERGPGFTTASVVDPFGNVLGVMFNQHYLDMLAAREAAA